MPVDLSGWGGTLSLPEVEDKPVRPLRVRYGSVEIEELGQVLTPTQVVKAASKSRLDALAPSRDSVLCKGTPNKSKHASERALWSPAWKARESCVAFWRK
uniref:Uncharacterized protein n=1 Tax=Naja naja TaxID=35670 RepID=A0A8C7DYN3_NAJNA